MLKQDLFENETNKNPDFRLVLKSPIKKLDTVLIFRYKFFNTKVEGKSVIAN